MSPTSTPTMQKQNNHVATILSISIVRACVSVLACVSVRACVSACVRVGRWRGVEGGGCVCALNHSKN